MARAYPGEAIRKMAVFMSTNSSESFNWLMGNNYRELLESALFIREGRKESFQWLVSHNHYEIAAFSNAVTGDKEAFRWLMQYKSVFWAATANAANRDKQAMQWLREKGFDAYVQLAEAIILIDQASNNDVSGYYRNP